MKARQQKVASFFLDNSDNEEALLYVEKNAPLLKGFVLLFAHPISKKLEERCRAWELCYAAGENCLFSKKTVSADIAKIDPLLQEEREDKGIAKKQIFRNIRSGESIVFEGDLLIHGNINDGALISTGGTLSVFGIIEGDILCNGDYLILSVYKRGKVIFQGEPINDLIGSDKLKMFYKEGDLVKMKELH